MACVQDCVCFKCRQFMKCVENDERVERCEKLAKSLGELKVAG
jgi:hypothetical protein